jgi:hypothetical protein
MPHALMVTDVTLLMLSFGVAAVLTTNRERWTDLASFCNKGDGGVSVCLRGLPACGKSTAATPLSGNG